VSASAGHNYQFKHSLLQQVDQDNTSIDNYVSDKLAVSVDAGRNFQYRTPFDEMTTAVEGFESTRPQVSVDAGRDSSLKFDAPNPMQNIQLKTKIVPRAYDIKNMEIPIDNIDYSCGISGCKVFETSARPQVSAHAGNNYTYTSEVNHTPQVRQKKVSSFGSYTTKGYQPQANMHASQSTNFLRQNGPQTTALKQGRRPALSIQT
jgi:hypothetical protein